MGAPQLTRGKQTREEILVAAKELFLARGFTATTMRQIARAVGITPAAIYNHFSGKDEIFTTVLHAAAPFDALFALLHDLVADTPEAMLRQLLVGAVEFMSSHKDYVRLAMIDSQERDGATLITLLPKVLPRAHDLYRRLVELDATHGQLRDMPFLVFMRALVSFIIGYLMTDGIIGVPELLQLPETDWANELAAIFMQGVLNPAESKGD